MIYGPLFKFWFWLLTSSSSNFTKLPPLSRSLSPSLEFSLLSPFSFQILLFFSSKTTGPASADFCSFSFQFVLQRDRSSVKEQDSKVSEREGEEGRSLRERSITSEQENAIPNPQFYFGNFTRISHQHRQDAVQISFFPKFQIPHNTTKKLN